MKKLNNLLGCEEIPKTEMMSINGGESLAYWFGYAVGKTARAIQNIFEPCKCSC